MTSPSRHRLALPEADAIAALLADVVAPTPPPPAPAAHAAQPNGRSQPAPRSAADFFGTVNWGNDAPAAAPPPAPNPPPAVPAGVRPARLPDLPAASFFGAVNWGNDPAKAAAVSLLLDPDGLPDPWATGNYLSGFVWD